MRVGLKHDPPYLRLSPRRYADFSLVGGVVNGWKRKGLHYFYKKKIYVTKFACWERIRGLDFISYHLIRWIHGDAKLREMGERE